MVTLSETARLTRVSNAVAAGTSVVTTANVDMRGFDGVQFTVAMGAITAGAVTSLKLQGSEDATSWSDLAETSQTIADDADNKLFATDVVLPNFRYVRCVVTRGTQDAVIDSVVAQQYRADYEPVTHDTATVGGSETHASAITGTA